jgi:uncharacterized protein YkwD
MSLIKSLSITFLVFAVLAGMVFLRLNAARINDLLRVAAIRNGLMVIQIIQLPPENNFADNATSTGGTANAGQTEKTITGAEVTKKILSATENISAPPVSEMPAPVPGQGSGNGALTRARVAELTNKQRQTYLGAGFALVENRQLDAAAAAKVKDMFAGQYFEHTSPAGHNAAYFIGNTGYEFIAIGENLALGDYSGESDLVKAWMASPGHRANILKPGYKEIGVAVGYGLYQGRQTWLAAQEFGIPKSACPAVDEALAAQIAAGQKALDQLAGQENFLLAKANEDQSRAQTLQKELNGLVSGHGSDSEILAKDRELNSAVAETNKDIDSYNTAVGQMQGIYNAYKSQIDKYNSQVNAYNSCADQL